MSKILKIFGTLCYVMAGIFYYLVENEIIVMKYGLIIFFILLFFGLLLFYIDYRKDKKSQITITGLYIGVFMTIYFILGFMGASSS